MMIFEPKPQFSDSDTFLFAVLGAVSAGENLEELLRMAQQDYTGVQPVTASQPSEFIDALLGLVALKSKSNAVISTWVVEEKIQKEEDRIASLGFEHVENLLR
ncbi:MAG: hypothetical protein AAF387_15470 [Pseudomonadota bacterium]